MSDSISLVVAFFSPFALLLLILLVSRRPKRRIDLVPPAEGDPRTVAEQVEALLRADKKIPAVKLVRERTGLSLRDAKEAVDAIERGGAQAMPGLGKLPFTPASPGSSLSDVPPTVLDQVRALALQGRKIEAIKVLRQHTRLGLKEAKEAVERL
ncbi:ribosomal protein L7/L12 [Micromonospora sp. NPDC003197]